MADLKNRLTKKDITLVEILIISYDFYKTKDNKEWRSVIDVKSARLVRRTNFIYNKVHGKWEQTGRDCRFIFLVRSEPTSYKHNSPLKVHWYPITFLIHDVSKGIYSPIKIREGSNFKPKFAKKGMSKERRKNIELINLKNGVQLQAFFDTQWVFKKYNLLYGPCYANKAPTIRNPKLLPFLSKHSYFIVKKILLPLLGTQGLKLRQLWKNE